MSQAELGNNRPTAGLQPRQQLLLPLLRTLAFPRASLHFLRLLSCDTLALGLLETTVLKRGGVCCNVFKRGKEREKNKKMTFANSVLVRSMDHQHINESVLYRASYEQRATLIWLGKNFH